MLAILGAFAALLLLFRNAPAHQPVADNLHQIRRTIAVFTSGTYDDFQIADKRGVGLVNDKICVYFFHFHVVWLV